MNQVEKLQWYEVADTSQVDELLPLAVKAGIHGIALYKVNDKIYATVNMCSHEEALLSDGYVDKEEIVCPIHQARFHIPSGKALCAPATEDIMTYPVRIEGERISVGVPNNKG